jgi:hypothetical protein
MLSNPEPCVQLYLHHTSCNNTILRAEQSDFGVTPSWIRAKQTHVTGAKVQQRNFSIWSRVQLSQQLGLQAERKVVLIAWTWDNNCHAGLGTKHMPAIMGVKLGL